MNAEELAARSGGMPDLLSCPFCGGAAKAHIWENHTGDKYGGVECTSCPAEIAWSVHWHDDGSEEKAKAIAAWNRRAAHRKDEETPK